MVDIRVFSLRGSSLRETRGLTIFLPKGYRPGRSIPAVFCADGQAVGGLSANVAAAIEAGSIPPTALVGVDSCSEKRAQEYICGVNKALFEAHERFFVEEVPQWLDAELGISLEREACGVFGFSNGGEFAVSMGVRHRDKFGVLIAFSVPPGREKMAGSEFAAKPVPRYYLAAGTKEGRFKKTTRAIAGTLERHGLTHEYQEREAGHDFDFWAAELPQAIRWAFRRVSPRDGRSSPRGYGGGLRPSTERRQFCVCAFVAKGTN
jgi:enterochelin esterase-like enzyme